MLKLCLWLLRTVSEILRRCTITEARDNPHFFFIHANATGKAVAIAQVLKRAVNAANVGQ